MKTSSFHILWLLHKATVWNPFLFGSYRGFNLFFKVKFVTFITTWQKFTSSSSGFWFFSCYDIFPFLKIQFCSHLFLLSTLSDFLFLYLNWEPGSWLECNKNFHLLFMLFARAQTGQIWDFAAIPAFLLLVFTIPFCISIHTDQINFPIMTHSEDKIHSLFV